MTMVTGGNNMDTDLTYTALKKFAEVDQKIASLEGRVAALESAGEPPADEPANYEVEA